MQLLLQSSIFPMKEFEDWEREVSKTWTDLKRFVQAVYQRKLTVLNLRMTSGTGEYVNQNMFHVLDDDDDIDDEELVSTANTLTQAAAHATINSGVIAPTTMPADVVTAINTLATNQATIVQQMAAFSLGGSRPAQPGHPRSVCPPTGHDAVGPSSTCNPCPPYPAVQSGRRI